MTRARRRTAISYSQTILFRYMACVVAPLACLACTNINTFEATELTIEVQGTITALDTGLPIDSAFVDVQAESASGFAQAFSDSTGLYAFSFVYRFFPGQTFCPFLVFVSADGYLDDLLPLTCRAGLQTVDYQLQR